MATDHNFRIKNGLTVGAVEVIDSSGKLTATAFGTNADEKIEDVAAAMITGATHSNITVTYNDTNGTLAFSAAAQYGDSDVEDYLDGGTSTPVFASADINGDVTLDGKLSIEHDGSNTGDVLSLFDNRFNATTMYGFGLASGTLYYKANTRHQFYSGANYDNSSYDVQFDGQNFVIRTGNLMMGSNTFVDSSRNITAGTISSGVITATQLNINSGTTNTTAVFSSSDDKAFIRIKDDDTDAYLISKDGNFSIGNTSSDYNNFKINLSNGNVTFDGTLTIPHTIDHSGDTDTYVKFDDNRVRIVNGGSTYLDTNNGTAVLTNTTSFGGDVSGTYNAIVIADDSHNHVISNVDGLQSALDNKIAQGTHAPSNSSFSNTNPGGGFRFQRITGGTDRFTTSHHNLLQIPNSSGNNYLAQMAFETGSAGLGWRSKDGTSWTDWYEIYHEGHKPTYSELGTMAYSNLTGTPTIPSLSGYATESYVDTAVSNLVDSAPGTLNTLNELAAALGDDANFSTTVTNSIATKLPLSGGTMTGTLTMGGNTITGSNFNISGVNALTINDPGEGIVFTGTNNVSLYAVDDSADNIMKFDGAAKLLVSNNEVYHEGHKPTYSELGTMAYSNLTGTPTIPTSLPANGGNSDTVDNLHAASFLRSDAEDSGTIINLNGGTANGANDATLYITAGNNADWGLKIDSASGKTEYGATIRMPSSFNHALSIYKNGADHVRVDSTGIIIGGTNYVWHAGNDGANSGLDADLLDGQHGSYYATASSLSSYLPLAGGTMSGAINMGNQQIYGINNLRFNDPGVNEGIKWDGGNQWQIYESDNGQGNNSGNLQFTTGSGNGTRRMTITTGGVASNPIGSNATYSRPLLEITTGSTPTQIKITTNILYSGTGASTHAHSVTIRGFQYGSAQMADLQIGWHVYNNQFYNRTVTSSGSWAPTVTLAVENNKVVIHLASPGYWPKLYVESMYNAFGGTGQAEGWSWSDAAISADSNTPNQTVPYKSNFGASASVKVGSNNVWHAGNDGASSGLDADLLDGQEGSYYLNYNNFTNTPTIPTNYITNNADDTMVGNLTIDKGTSTTLSVKCDNGGNALVRAGGDGQGTGIFEVTQDNGSHGGGMSYNGDGSPAWVSGETSDHVTFYRIDNGTRTEVFHYPYSSNTVNFNAVPTVGGSLMMTAANIGSYAAGFKYAFANNNGTNNGGYVEAGSAQDGIYFNGTNGITTSASGSTLTLSGANLLRSDVSDNYAGRTLSFGVPGQGTTTTACFASIEGNTDSSGEGSGRLFFREHNSTTGSMDAYGMSLGYRGGSTSVTTAGGNTWTGLSQIGNGEWGMWGHNGDNTGNLIMHGPRDGSYLQVDGNLEVNNGATTTLSVRGSGTGQAKIWARGSSQGTGMVMVSQDDNHGGGIEYNGDNNPSTTGAGADYIALFRVASGTYSWTARNLYSSNDWEFRGNVSAYASDERLKENIAPINNAVEKVKQLRGVTFDWKDDCEDKGFMPTMKHETGVIAQDVQKVIPDAAVPAPFDEDYLTVKHEKIIPVLIEAVKEQQEQIEELKSIINTLVESK